MTCYLDVSIYVFTVFVSLSCSFSSVGRQYFVVDTDRLLDEWSSVLSKQSAGAENDLLGVVLLYDCDVTSNVDVDLSNTLLPQSLTSPLIDGGLDVVFDELLLRPGVGNVDVDIAGTVTDFVDSKVACLVILLLWFKLECLFPIFKGTWIAVMKNKWKKKKKKKEKKKE